MKERTLTRGEVPELITANHELDIIYLSLLVRCTDERVKPAGDITAVGFEDHVAMAIQDTLQTQIYLLGEVSPTTRLNTSGLYIVKSPEADQSQRILGGTRTGEGTHSINGIARIVCVDRENNV